MTYERPPLLTRASEDQTRHIFDELLRLLDKSPAPQMKLCEPHIAWDALHFAAEQGHLLVFGDFAILVDVGSPWHTSKRVLIEEIIVRFRREYGNTVESAIAQLDVLARKFSCAAVVAGDTQIGLMSSRYLAAGFQPLGMQFYKGEPSSAS